MGKRLSYSILLAFFIGFSSFLTVKAQTYSVNPSETDKPKNFTYTYNGNTYYGYTKDGTWIKLSASVSGNKIKFTATKNSGTFNNKIVLYLYKGMSVSGSTITYLGKFVDDETAEAGSSGASITVTPDANGSSSYRAVLVSMGSSNMFFLTDPITVSMKLDTPDYTSFYASDIGSTSFVANWDAVDGATKYGILVRSSSGTYQNPAFEDEVSSTSCVVKNLDPGTSYYFQIQARNGNSSEKSDWSKSIAKAVTTTSGTTQLATPNSSNFSYTNRTATGFTAKWSAVSGATKYGILVRSASGSYSNPDFEAEVTSTSCNVIGLKPNTPYYFQIQARNSNSSEYSDWSKGIADAVTTLEASSPDYTVNPSITDKPTTEKVYYNNNTWNGFVNSTYIQAYAVVDGNKVIFTAKKNSGVFNNSVSLSVRKDLQISGSSVTNAGSEVGSNSMPSGYSCVSVSITPDFTSGHHTYTLILTSYGSLTTRFYTNPLTVTAVSSGISDDDCTFSDLDPSNDYYSSTCYLYKKGVLNGSDENGKMSAGNNLKRAHLAKIAFRGVYSIKNRSVPSSVVSDNFPTVYSDLTDKSTYYFQAAKALMYLEYGDGVTPFDRDRLQFAPEENITRLHTLKVLMETFNIQPDLTGTNNPFPSDADVTALKTANPKMMGYVRKAASLGIITTENNKFRPYDNCKRGEAFVMLARIMQKVDAGSISDPHPDDSDYFQPLNVTLKTIALGLGLPMGNFQHYTKTSFSIAGTVPLLFAHNYNSYNTSLPEAFFGVRTVNGVEDSYQPLGPGWSHTYHSYIALVEKHAVVHWGGGSIDVYESNGTRFVPTSIGVYDEFEQVGSEVIITTKKQMKYHFSKPGGSAPILYLTKIEDRNGNTLTINYETGQNGFMRIRSVNGGSRSLSFSYKSGTNLLSSVKDPLGRSISFDYNQNNQLSSFTDAKNQTTSYLYGDTKNTSKLLTRIKLPKGNYIENEYDANRRLSSTVSGIGSVPTTQTSVSVAAKYGSSVSTTSQVDVKRDNTTSSYNYTFNANNVVTKLTGDEGLQVTSSYSDSSHPQLPTSVRNNNTNVSNVQYDDKGNVTSVTVSGDGTLITKMTYDSMNNLTSVRDARGNTTTYSYDSKGNLTDISAPEGRSSSISYNSKGLPTEIVNPMGVSTTFTYNTYGNLTKVSMPALSLSSTSSYDAASRMISSTDALNRTTKFVYDENDNLLSETDPANNSTSYDYDKNDNLISITNAKGGVTTLSYDNATDWLTSMEFGGATKRFTYNDDGTLNSYTKPDGTRLNYDYDDLGRVTFDGVNSYSYDSKLRLQSVSGNGKTLSYTYDGFNRITGTSCDGHSNSYSYDENGNCLKVNNVSYTYDNADRMKTVKFNGKTITYTYRKDNKLSKVSYPNGMTTTYDYDNVGRLTSKKTTLSNGTVVASYSFTLDKEGNITSQKTQEPYSDMNLANETVSYTYNSANRITKAGNISFSFDENGNTTKRGDEQYRWDKSDRLTRSGSTNIDYDPLGLIASYGDIEFTTNPLGIGTVLSDSKSGAEYIYGHGLEARVLNGKTSYYVTDVRGSVVAIVDDNNNITHKYQYDEFGKVVQQEEADFNPFKYVGGYGVMYLNDHLYYMRARHYDPAIGRFLSEDPIWSINLFPYADNNPIMGIDPKGLKETEILKTLSDTFKGSKTPPSAGNYGNVNYTLGDLAQLKDEIISEKELVDKIGASSTSKTGSQTSKLVGGSSASSTDINYIEHIPWNTINTAINTDYQKGQELLIIGNFGNSIARDGVKSVVYLVYQGPGREQVAKIAQEGVTMASEGYGMLLEYVGFFDWCEKQFTVYYINKYNDVY